MDDTVGPAPFSPEHVEALAPDPASLKAGRQLASPAPWSDCGHDGRAVWGSCKGSGAQPYQVTVDSRGPGYRCSCPSRKFPCKHAIGLMLRWARADPQIVPRSPPAEVAGWLAGREARTSARPAPLQSGTPGAGGPGGEDPGAGTGAGEESGAGTGADEESGAGERTVAPAGAPAGKDLDATEQPPAPHIADPAAAAARAERRAARIVAGMAELDRWLEDLVRQGIAQAQSQPFSFWEQMAARLVDAQAPGAANRVRHLAGIVGSGEGWPARLLERLAELHLLAAAWARADELPDDVRADLRAVAGWAAPSAEVLADASRPREAGRWYVLARSVTEEEPVRAQRTWLWELDSGRLGVLVDFARPGASFAWDLWPGNVLSATLARYPGSAPLRVLVAEQHADPAPGGPPPSWPSIEAIAAARAAVVSADPWLERWPVSLSGAVPDGVPGRWTLRDEEGSCVQLGTVEETAWELVAACGGRPATVLGEWQDGAVRPLGAFVGDRMVVL
ncbi:MAG TPA: SWIM zinc finger family protein [Acidimicrobiales bacterium]|nr:SWIM zinc finger family protein [Acidimicrobiales bacterium]